MEKNDNYIVYRTRWGYKKNMFGYVIPFLKREQLPTHLSIYCVARREKRSYKDAQTRKLCSHANKKRIC